MKSNNSMRLLIAKTASFVKQFLYVLVLGIVFSACSGDGGGSDATSDYYFKATLDGRKVDFYNVKFQGGGNDNRFEQIVVGGEENPSATKPGEMARTTFDFEIWKLGGNITAGTYATPADEGMMARYSVLTPNGYTLYNTIAADDIFTVKIESISTSGIKGTFSGKVRSFDTGAAITVTEGTFNLPYNEIINRK